ncbi:MAG: beta-lactamase family protein [Candidatus Sericytochromatia bacterium]|nr:beta-lactamase family protein [Candidatus Sericytochromatia bacterium]
MLTMYAPRQITWPNALTSMLLAVVLTLGTGHAASAAPLPTAQARAIDTILAKSVKPNGPGAVVTVTDHGQVVYQKTIGLADIAKKTPLTAQSVFDLASCSKHFTAMAVLILVDRGLLSLNDDVRKYVPELTHKGSKTIRIVDLLHMVSGLAIYTSFMDDYDGVDNVAIAKAAAKQPMLFATGTKYEYNNTDYTLAALVVERASGQRFSTFMQAAVFGPLGMSHTVIMDAPNMQIRDRTPGYTVTNGKFVAARSDTVMVGDGNVYTSADDLVAWDRALLKNTLVKPATQRLAVTSGTLASGAKTEYGFGWTVPTNDPKNVWHDGSWDGTATYISRGLDDGLTLTILSNNDKLDVSDLAGGIEGVLRPE